MALTEQQLEELALRIASEQTVDLSTKEEILIFTKRLIAALPKPEPVGVFANVNEMIPGAGARWEHMMDEAYNPDDGYIYLYKEAPIAPPASEQKPVEHWKTPTSYLRRIGDAIELLCSGNRPSDEIISAWLDISLDDFRLQEFTCEHGPSWSQGIAVIDAAMVLADQPTEGVDHELSPQPDYKAQRDALMGVLNKARNALVQWHVPENRYSAIESIDAAIVSVKGGA